MRHERSEPVGDQTSTTRSLMRGIEILRLLVEAGEPMSPTELAGRVGLHQSSVSRALATLADAGYVRKTAGRRFEPDFGVLTLAAAVGNFPLARKPRAVMEDAAARLPGVLVTLSMLWRGQILYFVRADGVFDEIPFWGANFPLHQSAPGMRMLLTLPESEALELLRGSHARNGWPREKEITPADEVSALHQARELLDHDILIRDGWHRSDRVGSATLIDYPADYPVAVSLTTQRELATDDQLRLWLHEIRRAVEKSLQ
ncbi:MAG TPA: helix-turn-helix domain-containing protein [Mycobacteriales bacterium]|nr:helix-turn-helix domain-containing protein [Mycobacteriales bacterium]